MIMSLVTLHMLAVQKPCVQHTSDTQKFAVASKAVSTPFMLVKTAWQEAAGLSHVVVALQGEQCAFLFDTVLW